MQGMDRSVFCAHWFPGIVPSAPAFATYRVTLSAPGIVEPGMLFMPKATKNSRCAAFVGTALPCTTKEPNVVGLFPIGANDTDGMVTLLERFASAPPDVIAPVPPCAIEFGNPADTGV